MDIGPGMDFGDAYQLIEEVGRGGMGAVYKAYQPALDRYVAIKVLSPALAAQPGFRERFQREAVAIAKLRHPNIVLVYDFGEQAGADYLVTEFIDGRTLAAYLGVPLPMDFVARVLRPIAAAIDYAHGQGIVHRDIKPSNILLAKEGRPVLTDFGLVKLPFAADPSAQPLTAPGILLGTPEYMAPEFATGESVGATADLYALAVVAYEMLTGRVPYTANTPLAILLAHASQPLPLPHTVNPQIPPAVEQVLLRGLAKDPQDRYPTATAFTEALATADRGELAAPAPTGQPPAPPAPVTAQLSTGGGAATPVPPAAGEVPAAQGPAAPPPQPAAPAIAQGASSPRQGTGTLPARGLWQLLKAPAQLRPHERRAALIGAAIAGLLVVGVGLLLLSGRGGNQPGPGSPTAVAMATSSPVQAPTNTAVAVVVATPSPVQAPTNTAGYPIATNTAGYPIATNTAGRPLATPTIQNVPSTGRWGAAASMHTARAAQQAVRLLDGRVLIAGGTTASGPTADAEIYNPRTGAWTVTSPMNSPRAYFSATVLRSGKVLVAGGTGAEAVTDTAELYDARTGTWSPTGSLHIARDQHTATLLPDGRVLVAGGETSGTTPIASAELYNPATGRWTPTRSMLAPHWDHTATLLEHSGTPLVGEVLVAGGGGAGAELYNPATARWTRTGSMAMIRYRHTATLLPDGRVLVIGGEVAFNSLLATAEIYNPRAGRWTPAGSTSFDHSRHTATLLPDGLVLALGGSTGKDNQAALETGITTAEIYNPKTGLWYSAGRMHYRRGEHSATLLANGQVLIAGGFNNQGEVTATAERYSSTGP